MKWRKMPKKYCNCHFNIPGDCIKTKLAFLISRREKSDRCIYIDIYTLKKNRRIKKNPTKAVANGLF